ncbi:MAG: type II toxin-antitoxin system VapB family antitoxin [Gemmatimonadota bacterium]|nr:MAG: type II toxin-antitoxin system VapB family antitoxin [Gemmatimonadota bacterium]
MRTTVRLDDALMRDVKQYAAEEGMTLTAVLHRALRELLARRRSLEDRERVPLPSFAGAGLQPGVDLDDSAALIELMERDDGSA